MNLLRRSFSRAFKAGHTASASVIFTSLGMMAWEYFATSSWGRRNDEDGSQNTQIKRTWTNKQNTGAEYVKQLCASDRIWDHTSLWWTVKQLGFTSLRKKQAIKIMEPQGIITRFLLQITVLLKLYLPMFVPRTFLKSTTEHREGGKLKIKHFLTSATRMCACMWFIVKAQFYWLLNLA